MVTKILSILFVLLIMVGCNKINDEDVIARVNKEVLTIDQLKANFSENQWNDLDRDEKMRFVDEWIDLTVLAQEADKIKLSDLDEIQQKIELAEKNVKANALLAQKLTEIEISEDDLFDYYKLHKSKYQSQYKQYKLQRIFLREKAMLDSVLQIIKSGMKFTDATKLYSEENIGKDGGYTGFLGRKDMEPVVWDAIQELQKWQYRSVEVEDGFYIVRYYETRDVTDEMPFTELKQEIWKIVEQEKKMELYETYLYELKTTSDIFISL